MSGALQLSLADDGSSLWVAVKDGHPLGKVIFDRHYSRRHYQDGRKTMLYVGPGEKLVLIGRDGQSLFVWRKFISEAKDQTGINCAVFRNEGPELSSSLVREADAIADARWPGERHYTYVDAAKVRHKRDPGRCFLKAGWRRCGISKDRGLVILERVP